MSKKIKKSVVLAPAPTIDLPPAVFIPVPATALDSANFVALTARVAELEGDLVRVVDLLVKGDLDSAKFKAILSSRQGAA